MALKFSEDMYKFIILKERSSKKLLNVSKMNFMHKRSDFTKLEQH